jgi:SAM-dependent methyltransferase
MHAAVEHTLAFLLGEIGARRRVLEVGCGDGRVAVELARRGLEMTALDVSLAGLCEEARAGAGVVFHEQDVLDHRGGPYDAVVFTRSLHHIADPVLALSRVRGCVVAGGLLLAEEFDVEAPDEPTAAWYFGGAEDALARWRKEHEADPPLNTAEAMRRALTSAGYAIAREERVAYLYRALANRPGADEASRILRVEQTAIRSGRILPVGLRIVAIACARG